uniref:C2 domain-containing protein n=1 Tax=Salix viminalis TaxID=40686 RepID=A0A6N2LZH5_SALVM
MSSTSQLHYSSDLRPTAKKLYGHLNADGLHPMKTREEKGTSDTYCVVKYGQKWVRTRTIINSLSPKYNEQYTWEVLILQQFSLWVCSITTSLLVPMVIKTQKSVRFGYDYLPLKLVMFIHTRIHFWFFILLVSRRWASYIWP